MNWGVFVSTFLAASIEVIEMVAIVVAVGVTRSWRAARVGAAGGLVVLVVTVAALGAALQGLSLETLRLVVGALLLAFGSQWYRKGILIVSRNGWATGVGDEDVDDDVPAGFDWTGAFLAFKGVSLEGLEVAVIVVAFGAAADAVGSAVVGAAASVVVIGTLGAATYRYVAAIPQAGAATLRRRDAGHLRHVLGGRGPEGRVARRRLRAGVAGCPVRGRRAGAHAHRVRLAPRCRGTRAGRGGVCDGSGLMVVWRGTKAVVLFLIDYIIGDDWTVAALIALGMLATWRLVEAGVAAWWLLPLVVIAANVQSLRRAVRNGG